MTIFLVVGLVLVGFVVLSIAVGGIQAYRDEKAGKPDRYQDRFRR